MNTLWQPRGWLAVILGILIQPFVFLYVNRPGYLFLYIAITAICAIAIQYFGPAMPLADSEIATYMPVVIAITCAGHAFILAKNYDGTQHRGWYASWWAAMLCMLITVLSIVGVRTFTYDIYSIPAASMSPTLNPGDYVVVSKFGYGNYFYSGQLILQTAPINKPQRADLIVFRQPGNESTDFIKRVIGLPGDKIYYDQKQLYLSRACATNPANCTKYEQLSNMVKPAQLNANTLLQDEALDGNNYQILLHQQRHDAVKRYFKQPDMRMGEWIVPEGHFFVMGDSRDNSLDSRYWGFVPEQNIVGKAVYIF